MKKKRKYDNTARQANTMAGPCPDECGACKAILPLCDPPRLQKTRVYAKRGAIRYCVCDNCGATWKRTV